MMETLTIELTFRIEDFRSLYYSEGRKNIFQWKSTRKLLLTAVCFGIFSLLTYIIALNHAGWAFVFIISILITVGSFVFFLLYAYKYYQWKGGIEKYLKGQSR